MARKNLFGALMEPKLPAGNSLREEPVSPRNSPSAIVSQGAIGSVSRSLEQLKQKAADAQRVQDQLTAGETIIELDPALIDGAMITDRLGVADDAQEELRQSIGNYGQQVPVLVRPHPVTAGRFQIAYGHRRLRAVTDLGRSVRAVVRSMSDDELVIAQGLENSARANLSFIERAVYAAKLEAAGYSRLTIMAALSIDKTVLSKLITVPSRIPTEVITAIGPAPKIGRDRWMQFAEKIKLRGDDLSWVTTLQTPAFAALSSDDRFEAALKAVLTARKAASGPKPVLWRDEDGKRIGQLLSKSRELVVSVSTKTEPGFADFIRASLPRLLREFRDRNREAPSA
jgi:ParB family transcriptional regulator, chromosome partitioning protein